MNINEAIVNLKFAAYSGDLNAFKKAFIYCEEDNQFIIKIVFESAHLNIVKWIAEAMCLNRADIVSNNNLLFRSACERGFLDTAKWVAKKYKLTKYDVHSLDGQALKTASVYCFNDIEEWIRETYPLDHPYIKIYPTTDCAICMTDMTEDIVAMTKCGHPFHEICIKTWLNTSDTCPMCKQ